MRFFSRSKPALAAAGLGIAAIFSGCGEAPVAVEQATPFGVEAMQELEAKAFAKKSEDAAQVNVEGMDLYMHELEADGTRRNPRIWVHADSGTLNPDQSWALVRPEAIVYREAEEDIHLSSEAGSFDNNRRIAELTGNVSVKAGTLQLETGAFEWNDNNQIARTERGVTVMDGASRLEAQIVELRPEDGSIEMKKVSGRLTLRGLPE